MRSCSKAVLLVIDGLRPDAIGPETMPTLSELRERFWSAAGAVTVRPSVTVAALSSLATGVSPSTHGLIEPGLSSLGALRSVQPLPQHLRRYRRATTVVTSDLPGSALLVARTLLGLAGVGRVETSGATPAEVAAGGLRAVGRPEDGLTIIYLNDTDRAGHAYGWMSASYLEAAARADGAVAILAELAERDEILLVVTADHGGGGVAPNDHDAPHPVNDAIPLILAGPAIRRGARSNRAAALLDIPPTILHALGVPIPPAYEGRVLAEAFQKEAALVA